MGQTSCVFCRIISGEIPAKVIDRSAHALAILDAFPLAIGHVLVISNSHVGKVQDLGSAESQALFELVRKVIPAVELGVNVTSTTIAIHNGSEAGQEIPHVHVHVIPRKREDGAGAVHSMFKHRPESASVDMDSVCRKIISNLS
jgi:histidine triad (HIT) family protein